MAMGRGLDALFDSPARSDDSGSRVKELRLSEVEPRADQPRKHFDREQLQLLANSIAQHGVIQPIIVLEDKDGIYRIIAGERRWRAARLAGLETIPAIVRTYDEQTAAEVALIENLQREDLNPIEEALGYQSLMLQFGFTQEQVSERVGKSRPAVANTLRLLSLDSEIQNMIVLGKLTSGHARALLGIEDAGKRLELAKKAAEDGLTVREMEQAAKEGRPKRAPAKHSGAAYPDVEKDLQDKFGTKVRISGTEKGKIEFYYYSEEDLIRLIDMME